MPDPQPPQGNQPPPEEGPSVNVIPTDLSSGPKQVPQALMPAMKSMGWEQAYAMRGPDGSVKWAPDSWVNKMRDQNWELHEKNPGLLKTVSPKGDIAYIRPEEAQDFQNGGHTIIKPDGSYRVVPIPGEQTADVMERAAKVAKTLNSSNKTFEDRLTSFDTGTRSTGDQRRAEEAEFTQDKDALKSPNPLRNPLLNAPMHGVVDPATMFLPIGPAKAAIASEPVQLLLTSPKLYGEYLSKQGVKWVGRQMVEHGPDLVKAAAKGLGWGAGAGLMGKMMGWWGKGGE